MDQVKECEPKPVTCPACGAIIGVRLPRVDVFGCIKIRRRTTVECLNCNTDVRVGRSGTDT